MICEVIPANAGLQAPFRRQRRLGAAAANVCTVHSRVISLDIFQLTLEVVMMSSTSLGEAFMYNTWAAAVCAAGLWVIAIAAAYFEPVKRPAGEAWVVTASEKMPSRPALVRAHVAFQTADLR
jgi:hypothetical protein